MLGNIRETDKGATKGVSPACKDRPAFRVPRVRRLSALEIAEGALLADIAVVFHLLIRYLPVGGTFIALLVPVVFAVLVLRRGLYVGCVSLCVALFIICIVTGPGGVPLLLLEAGAGLFLGATMRRRLSPLLTIALGILCGGVALWLMLLLLVSLLSGPHVFIRSIQQAYAALTPLVGLIFRLVGLGAFWQHTFLPVLNNFLQWGVQNWPLLLLMAACGVCVPLVMMVYLIVNMFLRLLGYQVRPFPGYRLEGLLYWLASRLFRLFPRRAFVRFPLLHGLRCEVRRLNIARLRQRRLAKEARKRV